ncbi:helix-turn-helix domain-containing protein [uncultured Marixanthomonas sp.]|uniref:helix-turn-helix domain-containing protein n=1 Tax=uncultured Marixanthomonas sp. TaxID=757245 RepID=UPI0030DC4A0E|tara:strand:- start:256055 stop:256378 length:324 start_codon:yes stop_codon:yes gene_type:complete
MASSQDDTNSLMKLLIKEVAAEASKRLVSAVEQHLENKIANALKGQKLLVDSDELAKQLMVSKSTIVKLRKQGLPTIRIGDSVRFDPEDVLLFINNSFKNKPDDNKG